MSKKAVETMPCPFCGAPPDVRVNNRAAVLRWPIVIMCANPKCGVSAYVQHTKHAEAFKAWNRRAK